MSQQENQWLVKDREGRIRGPFSTASILRKISRGEISGEEFIALYPGTKWIAITQEPQFYDKLLETISFGSSEDLDTTQSGADPSEVEKENSQKTEIVIEPTPPPFEGRTSTNAEKTNAEKTKTKTKTKTKKSKRQEEEPGEVIELKKIETLLKHEILKRARIPVVLLAAAAVIAMAYVWMSEDPSEKNRIHLLMPQIDRTHGQDSAAVEVRLKRGAYYYVRDTFPNYLKAQDELVQAVEADHRNGQALAMLCMTYLELWPYAYQDSQDLKTIRIVTQNAVAIDPAGPNGSTCRVLDLYVRGRDMEAKSLTESVLDNFGNSETPPVVFYYLKAKLLETSRDYRTAIGYLNSAEQLWPQWLAPHSYEAELLLRLGEATAATKKLQQILKTNPDHKVAKIKLGLIEYRHFNHPDRARDFLLAALEGAEDAPKNVLAQGYFGLAEIALNRNENRQALNFIQKAYELNPGNDAIKSLLVKLGGVEKLQSTKVAGQQLIYEGDQFVREGDCNAAQAHYKAAFEANKKNGVAAMKAAQCLWKLSLSMEAIEWLNRAIRADPKLIEAYVVLADYYSQRYNFVAAAKTLARAQSESPKSYDVFRGFALVELRRHNAQGAVNYAKKALSLYEADVETHLILAKAYLALKQYRDAYSSAAKAVEIDLNHREAQIVYARSLAGIQGVDVGVNYLTDLMNRYPLVTEYRLALGELYKEDERYNDAQAVFQQVIEIDEKPKKAWLELGRVLRFQRSVDNALEAFLKAAVLDPSDPEPLFEAGLLYLDVKKPVESRMQMQRVLRINPDFPLVHYFLGRAALMMNNPQEALNEAEEERKVNPNLAEAYLLAAEAYMALGQYRLCAREYQKAIQLRSQGADIYVKLAKCYRLSGSLDIAITMLGQAAAKESGNPEVYKEQGAVYEMKGDLERAAEAYEQYFTLDPSAPDRDLIRQRLVDLQRKTSF